MLDPIRETLTFEDVLLAPAHAVVHPADVDVSTHLTAGIHLSIPLLSAAMDTVTECEMAIALAREGGIGVIHKNMSIDQQVQHVDREKRSESGMILDPITLGPRATLGEAVRRMREYSISGLPVVDGEGRLVGILTNRDLVFETDLTRPLRDAMTSEGLVTAPVGRRWMMRRRFFTGTRSRSCPSSMPMASSAGSSRSRTSSSGGNSPTRRKMTTGDSGRGLRSVPVPATSSEPSSWPGRAWMSSSSIRLTGTRRRCSTP